MIQFSLSASFTLFSCATVLLHSNTQDNAQSKSFNNNVESNIYCVKAAGMTNVIIQQCTVTLCFSQLLIFVLL